jgi:pimeloyl-ACP methyl ester carboxylesterase
MPAADALGRSRRLFCFSAGATSAIRFAVRHPERVSALIRFAPPHWESSRFAAQAIADILSRNDFIYWATITYPGRGCSP